MSLREQTVQQRDPLAARAARPITLLTVTAVLVFACVMTWLNRDDLQFPVLAIAALLALAAAAAVMAVSTNPMRAPFTSRAFSVVVALSLLAHLLEAMAGGDSNQHLRDDWAPTSLAVLLMALAIYRPAKQIATAGVLSSIAVGLITLSQLESLVTSAPPVVFIVVAIAPVIALSIASALFAQSVNRGLDEWERKAAEAMSALGDGGSEWIARSVQQDRVTILNKHVVPYFERVIREPELSEEDRVTARGLSDAIRAAMVADVDRSWLDGVVEQARTRRGLPGTRPGEYVHDAQRLAQSMSVDQRTAVRAMVSTVFVDPSCDPESVRMSLTGRGARCTVMLRARFDVVGSDTRSALDPYLAVARILFIDVRADVDGAELTVRFSYDQW